jgi:hypothetical protein
MFVCSVSCQSVLLFGARFHSLKITILSTISRFKKSRHFIKKNYNTMDSSSSKPQQSSGGGSGPCAECDNPAKLRCANCNKNTGQMVFYCSKECQRANWPHHKNFCSLPIPPKMLTGPSNFFC